MSDIPFGIRFTSTGGQALAGDAKAAAAGFDQLSASARNTQGQAKSLTEAHVSTETQMRKTSAASRELSDAQDRASASSKSLSVSGGEVAGEMLKAAAAVTALRAVVVGSIDAANEHSAALTGLASAARYAGEDIGSSLNTATALTTDGLMSVSETATALKNLLARGFSLEQSTELINRFKDSAAFGRQASLQLGEAVVSATEGLKNENSILVDNAGVTKNVSVMWKEYAGQIGVNVDQLTLAQKKQAEYNGIMNETAGQTGNAALATDGLAGATARMHKSSTDAAVSLGEALTPAATNVARSLAWVSEHAVKPLIFGLQGLGIATGVFVQQTATIVNFLTSPSLWNTAGIEQYRTEMRLLSETGDQMATDLAAQMSGATDKIPNIGKDSGARRKTDAEIAAAAATEKSAEASKKAHEQELKRYQDQASQAAQHIAVLNAQAGQTDKLTESDKKRIEMRAADNKFTFTSIAQGRQKVEALLSEAAALEAQAAASASALTADEKYKKIKEQLLQDTQKLLSSSDDYITSLQAQSLELALTADQVLVLESAKRAAADPMNAERINAETAALIARRAEASKVVTESKFDTFLSTNIEKSMTDAIFRGFENGKSFSQNFADSFGAALKTAVLDGAVKSMTTAMMTQSMTTANTAGAINPYAGAAIIASAIILSTSSNSGNKSGAEIQKVQATGQVFGDMAAKSATLADLTKNIKVNSDDGLIYSKAMVSALERMNSGVTGFAGQAARRFPGLGSGVDLQNVDNTYDNRISGLGGAMQELFGQSMQSAITSAGLAISGSVSDLIAGNGMQRYVDSNTTTKSVANWLSGDGYTKTTANPTQYSAVNAGLASDFGLIFSGLVDVAKNAASAMGVSISDVEQKVLALDLSGKLDLTGLSGKAMSEAISQYVTNQSDKMMLSAFSAEIEKYKQLGEEGLATITRLASETELFKINMDRVGVTGKIAAASMLGVSQSMIIAAGGADAYASKMSFYTKNFLSEAQQLVPLQAAVVKTFADLNMAVPATRDAFNVLMQSSYGTEAGAIKLHAALLDIAPAFDAVTKSGEAMIKTLQDAAITAFQNAVSEKDAMKQSAQSIRDLMSALNTSGMSVAQLKTRFVETAALAATGDAKASGKLGGYANDYLSASKGAVLDASQFASAADFATAQAAQVADYKAAQDIVQRELEKAAIAQEQAAANAETVLVLTQSNNAYLQAIATGINAITTAGINAKFDLASTIEIIANSSALDAATKAALTTDSKAYQINLSAALASATSDTLKNALITGEAQYSAIVTAAVNSKDVTTTKLLTDAAGAYTAEVNTIFKSGFNENAQAILLNTATNLDKTIQLAALSGDSTAISLAKGNLNTFNATISANLSKASTLSAAQLTTILSGSGMSSVTVDGKLAFDSTGTTAMSTIATNTGLTAGNVTALQTALVNLQKSTAITANTTAIRDAVAAAGGTFSASGLAANAPTIAADGSVTSTYSADAFHGYTATTSADGVTGAVTPWTNTQNAAFAGQMGPFQVDANGNYIATPASQTYQTLTIAPMTTAAPAAYSETNPNPEHVAAKSAALAAMNEQAHKEIMVSMGRAGKQGVEISRYIDTQSYQSAPALVEYYRLRSVYNDLPAFANGGDHLGGARIVGERGPEVEFTGPSRIMSNNDLMNNLRNPSNELLVAAVDRLQKEVELLREQNNAGHSSTSEHTKKTSALLDDISGGGGALLVQVVA